MTINYGYHSFTAVGGETSIPVPFEVGEDRSSVILTIDGTPYGGEWLTWFDDGSVEPPVPLTAGLSVVIERDTKPENYGTVFQPGNVNHVRLNEALAHFERVDQELKRKLDGINPATSSIKSDIAALKAVDAGHDVELEALQSEVNALSARVGDGAPSPETVAAAPITSLGASQSRTLASHFSDKYHLQRDFGGNLALAVAALQAYGGWLDGGGAAYAPSTGAKLVASRGKNYTISNMKLDMRAVAQGNLVVPGYDGAHLSHLDVTGEITSLPSLGADITADSFTVTFASPPDLEPGDTFRVEDTRAYSLYLPKNPTGRSYYHDGEEFVAVAITGNVVTTLLPSRRDHAATNMSCYLIRSGKVILESVEVLANAGTTLNTVAGVSATMLVGADFHGVTSFNAKYAAMLIDRCSRFEVDRAVVREDGVAQSGTDYGLMISSSVNGLIRSSRANASRHGMSTGTTGQQGNVPNEYLTYRDNVVNSTNSTTAAGFDFHGNTMNCRVSGLECDRLEISGSDHEFERVVTRSTGNVQPVTVYEARGGRYSFKKSIFAMLGNNNLVGRGMVDLGGNGGGNTFGIQDILLELEDCRFVGAAVAGYAVRHRNYANNGNTVGIRIKDCDFSEAPALQSALRVDVSGVGVEPAPRFVDFTGNRGLTMSTPLQFATGGVTPTDDTISGYVDLTFGTAPPTSGTFRKGAIRFNSAPTNGAPTLWRCITAGSPGTWLPDVLTATLVTDVASIPAGTSTTFTITVVGALVNMPAIATFNSYSPGIRLHARVSAVDTVTLTVENTTGGAYDPPNGTYIVKVFPL